MIRRLDVDGQISVIAGAPLDLTSYRDGPGSIARFDAPESIAVDSRGHAYIADSRNGVIRRISPTGVVSSMKTFADASGRSVPVESVRALAVDRQDNLFFANFSGIWRVSPSGVATSVTYDRLGFPSAMAVDSRGNIFITDGAIRGSVRKITPDGVATIIGGSNGFEPNLSLGSPNAIALDRAGNIFVAESFSSTIRKISTALEVSVVAGHWGSAPSLAIDTEDNLFVAAGSSIRKVTPAGTVTTIAGEPQVSGSIDGNGSNARFGFELGIALGANGDIYLADRFNNTIRKGVLLAHPARLANLSVLTTIEGRSDAAIMGAIVDGGDAAASLPVLARAAGPALASFGIANCLDDPKLELANASGIVAGNDNWEGGVESLAAFARVGAFPFTDLQSKDASLTVPALAKGSYTMRVSGTDGGGGSVLCELYDTTSENDYSSAVPKLANVSVLRKVSGGLTTGFIIKGEGTKTVLIRAVGPSLSNFGVSGLLADPKVELSDSRGRTISSNDNWGGDPALVTVFSKVGAFSFAGPASRDSALLTTLQPGSYTVRISSKDGQSGVALVEIFEVP